MPGAFDGRTPATLPASSLESTLASEETKSKPLSLARGVTFGVASSVGVYVAWAVALVVVLEAGSISAGRGGDAGDNAWASVMSMWVPVVWIGALALLGCAGVSQKW